MQGNWDYIAGILVGFIGGFIGCKIGDSLYRYLKDRIRIQPFFEPYDFWIGFYYDKKKDILYFCPLPCIGLKVGNKNAHTKTNFKEKPTHTESV